MARVEGSLRSSWSEFINFSMLLIWAISSFFLEMRVKSEENWGSDRMRMNSWDFWIALVSLASMFATMELICALNSLCSDSLKRILCSWSFCLTSDQMSYFNFLRKLLWNFSSYILYLLFDFSILKLDRSMIFLCTIDLICSGSSLSNYFDATTLICFVDPGR